MIKNRESGGAGTLIIILVVAAVLAGLWFFRPDKPEDAVDQGAEPTTSQPAEPVNPNTTGGSDATGTGVPNDPSIQMPSPAGGVDTNNSSRY